MTERDWRPKYLQMAETLREQIEKGQLSPAAPLPSESDLAAEHDLSRTSVRNAIRQLREWGLVRAEQGRGTYVRAPRQRVRRNHSERYQWEKDRVLLSDEERRETGATEHDTGLEFSDLEFFAKYDSVKANEDLATVFGVTIGTRLLRRTYRTRLRSENAPLNLVKSYLVYDDVSVNPDLLNDKNEPWSGGTQHQLNTIGIELDRIVDSIRARPPLPDEAEILDIEPGVAVLAMRKISLDINSKVVELSDVVMPGDRTELIYTTILNRWPT